MQHLIFELAGVPFAVTARNDLPLNLPTPYRLFLPSGPVREKPTRIRVVGADTALPPIQGDDLFWSCDTWRLGPNAPGRWTLEIQVAPTGPWLAVAEGASDFSNLRIRLRAGRQGLPTDQALHYPTDQFFLVQRLARRRALIVHAAGIIWEGRGYILAGRSGAGKTTLARIWRQRGARLLNDDRIIVREIDGQPMLFASPWPGEERTVINESAPLAGILHLVQAPTNRATPLGGAEAAAHLMATAVAPFYSSAALQNLLGVAERITRALPSHLLEFRPEAEAITVSLDAMRSGAKGAVRASQN